MKTPTLLILEDNKQETSLLAERFNDVGIDIKVINTGLEGVNYILKHNPDMSIIDLHLVDIKGSDIIQELRNKGHKNILILFSADTDTQSVEMSLAQGADNYWCKPMSFKELKMRIDITFRLWRRLNVITGKFQINGYTFDFHGCMLINNKLNHCIQLKWNEAQLLAQLLCGYGEYVKKSVLLTSLVQKNKNKIKINNSRTLNNIISELRKKITFGQIISKTNLGYKITFSEK